MPEGAARIFVRGRRPRSVISMVMEKEVSIDLENPEFQNVWKLIRFTRQSVFLTGKAGTGKSTFLKYICDNVRKEHVVLAPTGIAAVNVGGVTLHSFFRIPFKPLLPDDPEFDMKRMRDRMKYPKELINLIKNVELIVIDEISMVRADIIDFVDKILKVYTGNFREPFGGKQMLFVGDIFQLEPVVTGDMRDVLARYYPQPYFFNAGVFGDMKIVPVELLKVYRQTDSAFVGLLDRVRVGRPLRDDISRLNAKVIRRDDGRMVMTLATTRDIVDNINSRRLDELHASEIVYTGMVKGDFPMNSLPTSIELVLKVGAQVVFIKNDPDRRWVNGTIGRVYDAQNDRLMVELDSGECHSVELSVWHNIKYEYDDKNRKVIEKELGSFTQFPVKLAWALTIHKSQGLTFKDVVVDVGHGTFAGGQTYVALSRCRSLEGLSLLSTLNERDIFVNPSVVDFSRLFNDSSLIKEALDKAKADDLYTAALDAVGEGDVERAFDLFVEASDYRDEWHNPAVRRLIRRKLSELGGFSRRCRELEDRLEEDRVKFRRLAAEYVSMGDECRREGMEPTPAIANYDKALSIYARCYEAWTGKGFTYAEINDRDEAINAFMNAYRIDAARFTAPCELGRLYFAADNLAEALNWYLIALDIDDRSVLLHEYMADLYEKVGDDEAVSRHRSEAAKLRKKQGRRKR